MSVKFEITRSDNGNRFLCKDCIRSVRCSGTLNQETVYCSILKSTVKYEVTNCSHYQAPNIMREFEEAGTRFFGEIALYYVNAWDEDTKTRENRFVDFLESKHVDDTGYFFTKKEKKVNVPVKKTRTKKG